ncbi:MAG: FGGY family carbohydrate kinase, partial [Paracoccaceae bacterium]
MDRQDQFILSIDGGTQSTKVAIFDLSGHEICAHSVKLRPLDLSPDGRAEHPDDDLWDSLVAACQATLAKFSGDPKAIIGIGLGSIRCCRALLRDDGTLAAPIQNWMDHRLSKPYEHTDDTVRYVTTTTGYLTHRLTGQAKDTRANYLGPWPIDPITLEWMDAADDFA